MNKYNVEDINYIDIGEGKKILFLHGWGSSLEIYKDIINYLRVDYRCLAIDLPNFGKSKDSSEGLMVKDYATILNEFLMVHNFKPDLIIGHSFGGKIAIEYVINYGYDGKLLLCAPSIVKPTRHINYYLKKGIYKVSKKFNIFNDYIKNKFSSSDYKNASDLLRPTLIDACSTYYDSELKNIENKCFIYWGSDDKTTPVDQGKRINKYLKNSSFLVIEGGHFAFADNKYNFINTIDDFMEDN